MARFLHRAHKTRDMKVFKTEKRIKREARNILIYDEYTRLMAEPDTNSTKVVEHLAKKHDLSVTAVYNILREQKLKYK